MFVKTVTWYALPPGLRAPRGVTFRDGDIASYYPRSAITCPGNTCLWPKSVDGFVYVPYIMSPLYGMDRSALEIVPCVFFHQSTFLIFTLDDMDRITIETGMQDITEGTCIKFIPRTHEGSFLDIQPRYGWVQLLYMAFSFWVIWLIYI